jgi:hypothetical protein
MTLRATTKDAEINVGEASRLLTEKLSAHRKTAKDTKTDQELVTSVAANYPQLSSTTLLVALQGGTISPSDATTIDLSAFC